MTRLPGVTARQMVAALMAAGFESKGQKGSHFHLRHPVTHHRTTVPIHPGDLDRGLVKKILKQAGVTEDVFRQLL